MIVCSQCGVQLPDNVKYCSKCGSKVGHEQPTCNKCGTPIKPNTKFCSCCGNPLAQTNATPTVQKADSKPIRPIVCELCGGNNLIKENGFFTCQHCGTKYTLEEARKMMIEGTVQVAGTVRVDNSGKIGNFLMMANSAFSVENYKEAEEYANKVIEIDPHNSEAWYIKGKAAGWLSTLGKIRLSESVQCWGNAVAYSGNNRAKYQKQISDDISKLIQTVVLLRVNSFVESPTNFNMNGLLNSCELIDIVMNLQTKTQIPAQENVWREYIATSFNVAAVKGFDTANVYFGLQYKDRQSYKYQTWIEYCDNCIEILFVAMKLADTESTLLSCFNNALKIHNTVISSKTFAFNGQGYVVDQSLTKQAIAIRKKAIKELKSEKAQNLQRIQVQKNSITS